MEKAGEYVHHPFLIQYPLSRLLMLTNLCLCLILLAACTGQAVPTTVDGTPTRTTKQTLVFPNVGIQDLSSLDPTQTSDANSLLALEMIYSGLVRLDKDLNVIPDQATWTISADRKTYTFTLKAGLAFSDGTPLTAQSYVYSLTRALSPAVNAPDALLFLGKIAGASALRAGKAKTLSGVQAIDTHTLRITLSSPADYFLQALTNPLAFPVNQKVVQQYGNAHWSYHAADQGVGSGPFMVKMWQHNAKLVLVPNPSYYGPHTRLNEVDMIFAVDAHDAFQAYQGGQYNFTWNISADDRSAAHGLAGFTSQSLLETDALFFNTQTPPFDQPAVRQAFALALDKNVLAQKILANAVIPAPTIIPTGIPDYQPALAPLPFDRAKALVALQTVYPDVSQMPPVTLFYPSSLVPSSLVDALRQMWQTALGIEVKLLPVETNAYLIELNNHQVPFGFVQWEADFADPSNVLGPYLLAHSPENRGQWQNQQFDQLVQQAEETSGSLRLDFYARAEQLALNDVGWLPLDHQVMTAVLPPTVRGVSLNHMGLYFGDWSTVYLT